MRDCSKNKWPTRAKAQEHLQIGKTSKHYQPSHQVYYCLECLNFHVGRMRPKKKNHGYEEQDMMEDDA